MKGKSSRLYWPDAVHLLRLTPLPWLLAIALPMKAADTDEDRVAAARAARGAAIEARVKKAGLPFPPREIFLRAFKQEAVVEAWAREDTSGAFRLVASYAVTASSGVLGPKRREGDNQVPEGFYKINVFNPKSLFHLSMGLDYPNAADLVHADQEQPGTDIYIHGGAQSIGCLPLGDEAIEELYLLAFETRTRGLQPEIPVHIFPARMEGARWEALARASTWAAFWQTLQPAYACFERTHRLPRVSITPEGTYSVAP